MLRARHLAVVAALLIAAPYTVQAKLSVPHVSLPFEKYLLPNGLEVVLHEDHRTPLVAVNVFYHVGSRDEPRGRNGFAHLFEHLMFQGSKHVGEDKYFKYLEKAGSSDVNGTTSDDRTNYYETVPPNQIALALWLESDRMGFLLDHVTEQTFQGQRDVVKNERREHYEDAPYGLVPKLIREAVYPEDHPYHRLTIGTPEDLDRATLEDVRTFFRTYYVPSNATLVLAGDFDREQAKELVSRYFATLPSGPRPQIKRTKDAVTLGASKLLDVEADVELPRLVVTWPTPPLFAKGDAELDLLGQILSDGKTSRLYRRLVYDMQIAQTVSAYQASGELSSTFEITVTLRSGQDPVRVLGIVDEELDSLRALAPTEREISRAQAQIVSRMVLEMERVGSRANAMNQYNQHTGDPGFFDRDVARYTEASREAVRAATALLPKDRRIVTTVRPVPGAPRAGRLVGGG
jgi:predicted Zn-dependent peptidase